MANGAVLIVVALFVLFVVATGRGQCIGGMVACLGGSPLGALPGNGALPSAQSNVLAPTGGVGPNQASATYAGLPIGPTLPAMPQGFVWT
jgi:hypothetical protein